MGYWRDGGNPREAHVSLEALTASSSRSSRTRPPKTDRTAEIGKWPEKRLMLAVLEEAHRNYERYRHLWPRERRKNLDDVVDLFLSDDRSWPFSFLCICDVLETDPEGLRRRILDDARRLTIGRS